LQDNEVGPGVLAFRRDYEGQTAIVIFNTADRPVLLTELDTGLPPGTVLELLEGLIHDEDLVAGREGKITMELAGREGMVLLASNEVVELATDEAAVTILGDLSGQLFDDDIDMSGSVSEPGISIKVIVNGNLGRAIEVEAGPDGLWSTTIPLSEFGPGLTNNTVTAYAPDLMAVSDTYAFSTDVTDSSSSVTVFDKVGDDVGPLYTYFLPTDESFGGQMDILRTSAAAFGTNLQVEVEMAEVTEVWNPTNGFDHVLFHIFIDLTEQEGLTVLPRINAEAPEGFEWNYLGFLEGWNSRLYSTKDANAHSYGTAVTPAPQIEVDMASNTITFLFTSDSLGNPETLDGAMIYIATWDWNGPDAEYRFLRPGGGQWGFGGGDWAVDPLIIDDTDVIRLTAEKRLSQPDPVDDNHGPYSAGPERLYTLPSNENFGKQSDLRQVDVFSSDNGLLISLTTGEVTNIEDAPNGFDHARFHVFFDMLDGEGSEALPKLNAPAPSGFAWDYLAVVDGWNNELYSALGSDKDSFGTASDSPARIAVDSETNSIHLLFDPQAMAAPDSVEDLKVYVAVWDWDNGAEDYRQLTPEGGQWEFGGGDGQIDPLIIDDVMVGMPTNYVSQLPPIPQVQVTFEVSVPASTAADSILYLTGPFNQWNPADTAYQFDMIDEGIYRLVLSVDEGEFLEYRITRGSFANAEKLDPDDRFANRELSIPVGEESMEVKIDITGWWDD
jgi:hypothetical protein